jgi:hypothetical protein
MKWRKALILTAATPPALLVLAAIAVGVFLLLQPKPAPRPEPAETRDGRWQQDVEYLAQELPRLHVNAFHTTPQRTFDSAVAKLLHDIPQLQDHEILVRIAQIVAAVGDAHTAASARAPDSRSFPIRGAWFSDGFFVVRTAPGFKKLPRSEVLRIGDLNIEEVLRRVGTVVSYENETKLRVDAPSYLNNPDVLHALGVIPERDSASFTVRQADGDTATIWLPAMRIHRDQWEAVSINRPRYLQRRSEDFWFELMEDGEVLYFKYNRCRDPLGFWRFSRSVLNVLDEQPVERMVIDFRGNGGGNSALFTYLLLRGLKKQSVNQRGRLYGIIDGATFSSAVMNAAELRLETAAILVGEPTSGKPYGYGEVGSFTLPNSGLTVWYSSEYFEAVPKLGDTPSLEPDVMIMRTSEDYFTGKDAVLDSLIVGLFVSSK